MLVVMLTYARSGGTLLNKCLGSLPNVVMLSEVNPLASSLHVANPGINAVHKQAEEWYGISLTCESFQDSISELYEKVQLKGKHLVIRDWSYINFTPSFLNQGKPPNSFLILDAVAHIHDVKVFGFIRDAIDVWISSQARSMEAFFESYLKFATKMSIMCDPKFSYESFCGNPSKTLAAICEHSGIGTDDAPMRFFYQNRNVVGDTHMFSRGSNKREIMKFKRKFLSPRKVQALNDCDSMVEANRLLGYPTVYNAVPTERAVEAAKRILGKQLRKLGNLPTRFARKVGRTFWL